MPAGIGGFGKPPYAAVAKYGVMAALVALTAFRFAVSLPRADQRWRAEDTGLDPGWTVLADAPPVGAVVVAEHDEWLALTYLMDVWGAAPTVRPRADCHGEPATATYITRRAVAADPACLADRHRYAAGAELIRAQLEPDLELPAPAWPVDLPVGGGLRLAGYAVAETEPPFSGATGRPAASTPCWRLSLYWQTTVHLETDYTFSIRPQRAGQPISGPDGLPLIQDHQPAWNSYPTSRWQPGEVVRDDYVFDLPAGELPDGVQLVAYRAITDEQGGTTFETLGELELGGLK